MVETSYNGAYTELWYTQLGKVYMIGSGPYYAYWPAPGNGTAEVNGNAVTAYYMHKDWLGSARISQTIISHTVESDQAYAPFGEVYNKLTTGAGVPAQMFTGDTQDVIGGIFDTPNRDLNASQGRWLSPDPAGAAWNQYAYVNSNPLSNIDPSGLACYPLEKNVFGTCAGFMNNGVSFGQSWTELYIFTAALSGSYEAIDPSKKSIPMSVSNGQIAIGGCDGAPDCEDFEVPQLMTVYPNIRLLGMLSAITISVTALDPAALNPSLSSQAYMLALHSAFNKFPDLCNPGVGATGKLGPLAANLNVNQNGVQGTVSGEAGPLSVEGAHDMSINVGDGVGGTLGFDPMKGTIKNVGAFTGFKASGMELTVNVHADVVAMGSCPSK
jgi:RHS repeat-associated protein